MSRDAQPKLRILILGGGGREHALAWKLEQSPLVEHIYVAPGNGGTQSNKTSNVSLPSDDFGKLIEFAVKSEVRVLPNI
jgi:phosphoribosylamine--glycine ligase / phosphoribosylformylglycinamidine cyclo-ligase